MKFVLFVIGVFLGPPLFFMYLGYIDWCFHELPKYFRKGA